MARFHHLYHQAPGFIGYKKTNGRNQNTICGDQYIRPIGWFTVFGTEAFLIIISDAISLERPITNKVPATIINLYAYFFFHGIFFLYTRLPGTQAKNWVTLLIEIKKKTKEK
jgi:hypothetical protein